jgi:CheY-like chemotaxis protein
VALLSQNGEENEVLFLESGGLPCSVNPELPMPIRGLRKTAYDNNSTVYDNDFMNSEWIKYMPKGHVRLRNVMFSPLVLDGKTIGIIGLANKNGDFTEDDARVATGFGELAAIALQNSRNLDKRDMAEKHNERLIEELKAAIENIKQLKGLLPICSHCKKIRDDGGYWNQIEAYVRKYSEAEFSHSICPDCVRIHYPDLAIYGEASGDSKENRVARILIVEDDEEIRSVLGEILRSEGHETTLASNGKEGLRIFKEAGADVIITDIIMPDKEGLETIMELREKHPDVKIVAISGGGMSDAESYLKLAEKMGASCTLSKPFQREELLQVVNNLLAD